MPVTLATFENSFVTFDDQSNKFVSDRSCGYQRDFCIPVYDGTDVSFLFTITADRTYVSPEDFTIVNARPTCEQPTIMFSNPTVVFTGVTSTDGDGNTVHYMKCYWPTPFTELQGRHGDCFVLRVVFDDGDENFVTACTNCFSYIPDKCFTTQLKYMSPDDIMGFPYSKYRFEVDWNIIRLPMWLSKPQYPKTGEYYERSNGTKQTLFARIERQYSVISDDMPEWWMKNLNIALSHDEVYVLPEDTAMNEIKVVATNDFEIQWPEMGTNAANWGRPVFELLETPFVEINNNCS
jgi:hypothetical protein